jgi:hydroxymethylpyrimidine pyrophosphatase-like HAD family hydrolase
VNAWFGEHDKLTMSKRLLNEAFSIDTDKRRELIAYAGDSPNDAPMFGFFPNAIGVANVRPYKDIMSHLPHFVTENEGGYGFAEFAQAILDARANG